MARQLRYSLRALLRLAADEPLALMGHRFGESPSCISKIQPAVECTIPSPQRRQAMREYHVKQCPLTLTIGEVLDGSLCWEYLGARRSAVYEKFRIAPFLFPRRRKTN